MSTPLPPSIEDQDAFDLLSVETVRSIARDLHERNKSLREALTGLFTAEDEYQAHITACKDDPCVTCRDLPGSPRQRQRHRTFLHRRRAER